MVNYVRAMSHGVRRLEELPVCLWLIREIHGELPRGGKIRGDRVWTCSQFVCANTVSLACYLEAWLSRDNCRGRFANSRVSAADSKFRKQ